MRAHLPFVRSALAVVACASLFAAPAVAKDAPKKEPAPAPAAKTGTFKLETPPPIKYCTMAVPKDYDPAKWYPLAFILHPFAMDPNANKPEPWVDLWAPELLKRGWIIAGPAVGEYHTENTEGPLLATLTLVKSKYHVDSRRVVVIGLNAGVKMAWHIAVKSPVNFAAVMAFSAEIEQADRDGLKGLAGKVAYLYRGEKETYYTESMIKGDESYLKFAKVKATIDSKNGNGEIFPAKDLAKFADWMDGVYPDGAWKVKADAAQAAIEKKDLVAAERAIAELRAELKKSPYPVFEQRATALDKSVVDTGRQMILDATKGLDADPLDAQGKLDAVAKALKGVKALEEEVGKAVAAVKKNPAVLQALKKKEAEAQGALYMDRAGAAEAKGDLVKALEAYRKAAALDWSRKADAEKHVAELEKQTAGK